jgi:hypothetical protein
MTNLPVEIKVVPRIHPAFENQCILGTIKEAGCNTQRTNAITRCPSAPILTAAHAAGSLS